MNKKTTYIIFIVIILISILVLGLLNNKTRLEYEITYNGINCPTPYLKLYSDGTYEYYSTYATDESNLEPQKGKYDYDIKKILNNINLYSKNPAGPYTIKDAKGNEYITYDTNVQLMEFLNSHHIELNKCMLEGEKSKNE